MRIYLIGSLRNPAVPLLAQKIRGLGHEVFDDWFAAGPEADDYWQKYEMARDHSYIEALEGFAANHVFEYDRTHLEGCDAAVLLLPAGKSGHMEFGYALGQGKKGYIVLSQPTQENVATRWDVMYRFATKVYENEQGLLYDLYRGTVQMATYRGER